jgi:hypothetical protein
VADFLINDVALYVSKRPETTINTQYTAGADYLKALTAAPAFVLPQVEWVNDAGKPGNGHEFATYQCETYVTHPAITFTDDVNTDYAGRLLLRSLGGTVTSALLSGTAYKHSNAMKPVASGRQLPTTDVISELGGASFLLAGMVVDRYRLSQTRADRPQFTVDLVGSGKFVRPHGVTSLPSTAAVIQCLDGNNTEVSWTDTDGVQNFHGATCSLRSSFIEVANSTRLNDRCPGDAEMTITAGALTTTPAYVGRMSRGNRVVTAQIVIKLDSTVPDWITYAVGDILTDVTFKYRGPIITGAHRYALHGIIPKARITSVDPGEDDGDATLAINILGFYDTVTLGALKAEVVNTETANYD